MLPRWLSVPPCTVLQKQNKIKTFFLANLLMVTFVTQRTVLCFIIIEYANKLCADHNNNINKNNDNNNNNKNNRTFVNFVGRSGQPWKLMSLTKNRRLGGLPCVAYINRNCTSKPSVRWRRSEVKIRTGTRSEGAVDGQNILGDKDVAGGASLVSGVKNLRLRNDLTGWWPHVLVFL